MWGQNAPAPVTPSNTTMPTNATQENAPSGNVYPGNVYPGTVSPGNIPGSMTTQARPGSSGQADDSDQTASRIRDREQQLKNAAVTAAVPLTEFQQIIAASTGRILPIFGSDLFNTTPSTFAPVDNVPVTPDYVVGPGDELRLLVWGQVNQRGSYVVDRTGSISLPEVGTVHVAGVQFSKLTDFLKAQLGRVYRNFDLNVNLGQLRSIQVFVVGQARKPGSYTIGSLSTLLNALFASGGPTPQGSLRDIQVKRGNETITHFDLYDLLLHGDKSKDVSLISGDVIFIPDVGPQVAVLGSVTTPAVFELRGEKSFEQVIALAGGETNVAASTRLRVERIDKHTERSVINVDLSTGDASPVQDGDMVTVSSIIDRFKNAVTLRGNVANPGRYVWFEGMHVSDLIPNRDMLVTRNYYQRQNLLGQNSLDYKGGPLQEGSLGIQTGAVADAATGRGSTSANGGGNAAGATLTTGDSLFVARTDVILSAPDIDWSYAVIARQSPVDLKTTLVPFNLGKVILDKDRTQDPELLAGDVVTIFSKADIRVPSAQQTKIVKLEGEFVASGPYSVLPGETLRQLLVRAGGLTPGAYLYASEFTRESVRRLQRQRLVEYADALSSEITARTSASVTSALTDRDAEAAQASGAEARSTLARLRQAQPTGRIVFQLKPDAKDIAAIPDLELEDGDRFVVPKIPSSVTVEGQVYNANAFVYSTGKRVKDYLQFAGGPDRIADRKREFVLRADGAVVSYQYAGSRRNGNFNNVPMLPGDTIVVPPRIEKGAFLRELVNVSAILQGFGLGAAAIAVLK